jgi:hypothetical protein
MAKESKLVIKTTPFLFGGERIEVEEKTYYIKYKNMGRQQIKEILQNVKYLPKGGSLTLKSR